MTGTPDFWTATPVIQSLALSVNANHPKTDHDGSRNVRLVCFVAMANPSPVIPISYLNTSGEAIPPFGIMEATGDCDYVSATKKYSIKVRKPTGVGPYFIDTGNGASASGDGAYGQCVVPLTHTWWVKYSGAAAPTTAWVTEVGPKTGQFYVDKNGSGYWYAGVWDSTNGWILVMEKMGGGGKPIVMFQIKTPDCPNARALATVKAVTDGSGSPAVGDTIQICDKAGCFFNTTNILLNGRIGFAQQMKGVTCVQMAGDGTGTDDTITNPWVVFSLCYPDVTC